MLRSPLRIPRAPRAPGINPGISQLAVYRSAPGSTAAPGAKAGSRSQNRPEVRPGLIIRNAGQPRFWRAGHATFRGHRVRPDPPAQSPATQESQGSQKSKKSQEFQESREFSSPSLIFSLAPLPPARAASRPLASGPRPLVFGHSLASASCCSLGSLAIGI